MGAREWETVLNDLAGRHLCRDRLDWVAKKFLLMTMQEAEGLEWTDPWLQSIDLEYHNVSLEQGLFYELVRTHQMRRLVEEDEIRRAIFIRRRRPAPSSADVPLRVSITRSPRSNGTRLRFGATE